MNTKNQYYIILFISILVNSYATADELYLNNGDRFTGQLIEISATHCTFKINSQSTLHIKRSDISRLNVIQSVANKDSTPAMTNNQLLTVRAKGTENTSKSTTTLGEEPEEDLRQIFLRQSTVLLKPGEKELDISLNYTRNEFANIRTRNFSIPVSVRLGITDLLEGFIDLPIAWTQQEIFYQDAVDKSDAFGIGDVSVGLKYLFKQQDKQWPDVIGSFSFTAPTGDDSDPKNMNDVAIGSGHWHISTGLTLVKSYDPAVLFGSVGYSYTFEETRNGVEVAPGQSFSYSFGMGFAINNQITMSSQFLGAYQSKTELDGVGILGSSREPMSLRTGLTYRIGKGRYLEPAVMLGMNDDAPDASLTLSYSQKLDF